MSNQTGKLIARIAENLPTLSNEVAQHWIDNPKPLQRQLCLALNMLAPDLRYLVSSSMDSVASRLVTIAKWQMDGSIYRVGKSLHVNFFDLAGTGCMCGFSERVEDLERMTLVFKTIFDADEVVYHTKRGFTNSTVVEVEAGLTGSIRNLPDAHKGDGLCGTFPVIKGLGMRWVFDPKSK